MQKLSLFYSLLVSALCLFITTESYGHANGSAKIDLKIQDSSIVLYVDVNESDMYNAVYPPEQALETQEDSLQLKEWSFHYIRDRVLLEVNYQSQNLSYRLQDAIDSIGSDQKRTMVFILSCSKPDSLKEIRLNSSLFPEFGGQAIANVSLYAGQSLIKQEYLLVDELMIWAPNAPSSVNGEHGIPTNMAPWLKFLYLGFVHIIPLGLDHILFVLGLFFFTTKWKSLLAQVTAFTIAHSLTLGLSMLDILSLPASIIEPLIALSISYVAVENIFFANNANRDKWRWLMVFAFGLLHGMGFAGVLRDLQVPQDQFLSCLFFFNIGLEGGQLIVLLGAAALTAWFWKKQWYRTAIAIPASLIIGLIGLYWTVERILG